MSIKEATDIFYTLHWQWAQPSLAKEPFRCTPLFGQRTNAQTHKRTNAQTHKRTNAQMHKCTNAQTHKRTNAQTHKHTAHASCQAVDLRIERCRAGLALGVHPPGYQVRVESRTYLRASMMEPPYTIAAKQAPHCTTPRKQKAVTCGPQTGDPLA